ncbi:MAG: hypothetical protein ACP5CD_02875 [Thermovirgaceae bacterium]
MDFVGVIGRTQTLFAWLLTSDRSITVFSVTRLFSRISPEDRINASARWKLEIPLSGFADEDLGHLGRLITEAVSSWQTIWA